MENHKIQKRIEELEFELNNLKMLVTPKNEQPIAKANVERHDYTKCELSNFEIERYSRQMILPEVGVKGNNNILDLSLIHI